MKRILIIIISLILSVGISYLSVMIQIGSFGGFPIQYTNHAQTSSPGNFSNFRDGWSESLFALNAGIYFIVIMGGIKLYKKSKKKKEAHTELK